jgi:hypothetical protein
MNSRAGGGICRGIFKVVHWARDIGVRVDTCHFFFGGGVFVFLVTSPLVTSSLIYIPSLNGATISQLGEKATE